MDPPWWIDPVAGILQKQSRGAWDERRADAIVEHLLSCDSSSPPTTLDSGKLAPIAGLAPATTRLTVGRSTIELDGNKTLVRKAGIAPTPHAPKASMLLLHYNRTKVAPQDGLAPTAFPQTTGCSAN